MNEKKKTSVPAKGKKQNKAKEIWRRFKKNKTAVVGLIVVIFFILIAVFAELIVPYEVALKQTKALREPPSSAHWFGTDRLGRDVFARIVHGTKVSLLIGLIGTAISTVIGLIIGAISGYYGGRLDEIIMRLMDMIMSIPSMLLSLAVVAALGANMQNLLIALVVGQIPHTARANRALVMSVSGQEFVKAAKSYGAGDARIIFKYLVPNVIGPIIVQASMQISSTILSAAALSFLGMGIQPPQPEWGYMLSEAREFMRTSPYLIMFPGVTILLLSLAFNLAGDGLQDAFNPQLKD